MNKITISQKPVDGGYSISFTVEDVEYKIGDKVVATLETHEGPVVTTREVELEITQEFLDAIAFAKSTRKYPTMYALVLEAYWDRYDDFREYSLYESLCHALTHEKPDLREYILSLTEEEFRGLALEFTMQEYPDSWWDKLDEEYNNLDEGHPEREVLKRILDKKPRITYLVNKEELKSKFTEEYFVTVSIDGIRYRIVDSF